LHSASPAPALDPQYQYLRVTQGQQIGWLVYGGTRASPQPGLEAWYSADGGVLRLLNGRLVGYASATLQWRETHNSAPAQSGALWDPKASHDFERWVDRMPGWWVGEPQQRQLQAMGAQAPAAHRMVGTAPGLVWWRESAAPAATPNTAAATSNARHKETPTGSPQALLAEAWYAVDTRTEAPRVVYGQQCLVGSQPLVCVSWQRWPVPPAPAASVSPTPSPEPASPASPAPLRP
jgi:hypothetical protein